jgi:hypothetical protein
MFLASVYCVANFTGYYYNLIVIKKLGGENLIFFFPSNEISFL